MIIIIASEVPDVLATVVGEIANIVAGRKYFHNGCIIDHGDQPAPVYPTYTVGNRVFSIIARRVKIFNSTNIDMSSAILARLYNNKTQMANTRGIMTNNLSITQKFATTKRALKHGMIPIIILGSMSELMRQDPSEANYIIDNLASILIVSSPSIIKQPHGAQIMDLTMSMLSVYDNAIKCNLHVTLMSSGPVNQLITMISDYWSKKFISTDDIRQFPHVINELNCLNPEDYLHPVEHWPTHHDAPEYRNDLCTSCKSRLFDRNYAAYNACGTLHAFCPLCVHCTGLYNSPEYTLWYTFNHHRTAMDLIDDRITKFSEPLRAFLRAVATNGYAKGNVIGLDCTYCVSKRAYIENVDNINKKTIYGEKIRIIYFR